MVSIMGGKWTTYRRMAEETVDAVLKAKPHLAERKPLRPSCTRNMQLMGADRAGIVVGQKFDRITITLREKYGFHKDVAKHLLRNYGTRALQIAEIAERDVTLRDRLSRRWPFIKAEVVFAMQQEYALTPVDVLARRTRLAFIDTKDCEEALPAVLDLMHKHNGWSDAQRKAYLAETMTFLSTMNKLHVDEDEE
jgi:glycerol-3-phosphate dehydrogenase